MFCPQCGTESPSGLQYCRSCGANLKVIGKAVSLSEAIARSDRGPMPKIKEMMKNLKIDQVTEDISRALDQMNSELVKSSGDLSKKKSWLPGRRRKTAQERRDEQITKGMVSFFGGIAFMIFLYFFSNALVLKLPPHIITQVPFEIDPVVRMIWMLGLIPTLKGVGHMLAGLLISTKAPAQLEYGQSSPGLPEPEPIERRAPASITEQTTNILERNPLSRN